MLQLLSITSIIEINSTPEKIWDALVTPAIIAKYLFGTETICDWKTGSEIIFQGDYQGQKYRDKGIIIEIEPNQMLKYSYWSGFSGLEDIPENYSTVSYNLESGDGFSRLKLTQSGFKNAETQLHSQTNWDMVLRKIKEIVESRV